MKHKKFDYVKTLIENGQYVMLEGEAGTGKTTMFMQIAEKLGIPFFSITGTQQTSVANMLGFRAVNGNYISTQLREAYEHGGMYLMDEYDAFNPNTILALNSIENGFLSFPDKVVHAHEDFIICATCNPSDKHSSFTGRSKQDAASLDRYLTVPLDRDPDLEALLTSKTAAMYADKMRQILIDNGIVTRVVTMRDTMRFHKLQELSAKGLITEDPLHALVGKDTEIANDLYAYADTVAAMEVPLSSANNINELYELIQRKKGV